MLKNKSHDVEKAKKTYTKARKKAKTSFSPRRGARRVTKRYYLHRKQASGQRIRGAKLLTFREINNNIYEDKITFNNHFHLHVAVFKF